MPVPRLLFLFLSLVTSIVPAAALAQSTNAISNARLIRPLSIVKVDDLDFGGVAATSAGTVVIDPNANSVAYTGGAFSAGGGAHPAMFMGAAQKRTVVIIRIPKAPITLTRSGGTETLTVSNWTLQGQDKRELAAQSSFTFAVGATLAVPANAVEGVYTGSFNIEVQYP